MVSNSAYDLGKLLKKYLGANFPKILDILILGWEPGICIFSQFPGDLDTL